jgi:hypothetical protein
VDGPVVRIERVVTGSAWAIDGVIRDRLVPALTARPALLAAWAARHGPELDDERVAVTAWRSRDAALEAPRLDALTDEDVEGATTTSVAVIPVSLFETFERPGPPTILRLYEGQTRPGELEAYLEEARAGIRLDGALPNGPVSVCMSVPAPDRFITVSTWMDWDGLSQCTGGDIRRPMSTRNEARLISGGPSHFEIVASLLPTRPV